MTNSKYKCVNMTDDQFEKLIEAQKRGNLMRKAIDDAIEQAKKLADPDAYDFVATDWRWSEENPDIAIVHVCCLTPLKGWPLRFWKLKKWYGKLCCL